MLDIRKFKGKRYVFFLISVLSLFYCNPLPTDPGTLPPSDLKFDKTDFVVYVGDEVTIKPTVSNRVDTFTIAPSLPAGLTMDSKTGVINGVASLSTDSIKYTMFATNKNGSVKAEFSLTISAYPSFVIQPQTQVATIGGSVTFTATAKGNAPLTYNWTKDGVALADTGKTLKLIDIKASSAGLYRCVVKDRRGKTVLSDPAFCQISENESAPKIIIAPGSRSAIAGESVILTSSAVGSNLEYKWLFNGTVIPGATSYFLPIESVKASDSGNYVLIVSNKFGSDTSKPAAHLSIVPKTSSFFSFDISIIGKGSVVINNQKFVKDTTLKFLEGTTFTAALIADSAYILSSVFVDNFIDIDAVSNKQYLVSNVSQNHSINVSFTKLTGATPDSLFLISGVTDTATGKIETVPNKEKFAFNETVTLTAKPAAGYVFAGWSGSVIGINISSDIISFKMDIDRSIMATFVRKGRFTLIKTMQPVSGGIIKVLPDSIDYAAGTKVSVQAVPNTGYKFKSWSGASTSVKDTFSLSMDTNKTIVAIFEQIQIVKKDTLSVVVSISDTNSGTVTVLPVKPLYVTGDTVQLIAKTKSGFYFAGWNGLPNGSDVTNDTTSIVVTTNLVIIPQFLPLSKFAILHTVQPSFSGEIIMSPSQTSYSKGDKVKVTAKAATGYKFVKWGGASEALTDTITVTVDTTITILANFEKIAVPDSFSVLVANPDTNAGNVTIKPVKSKYGKGDTLQLIALAKAGYYFSSWSGVPAGADKLNDTISIIITSNLVLAPQFLPKSRFTITPSVSPSGSGEITLSPSQPYYVKGDKVRLTAKAASGFKFTGWSGASVLSTDTITLSVDTNIAIQANFEATRFALLCIVNPAGSGNVSKSDTLLSVTDTFTITAVPNTANGYEFKSWRQTGGTGVLYVSDSVSATAKVAISKGPVILTAVFAPRSTFTVTVSGVVVNGSILIAPVKQAYFIGDTITVTARPEIGYTFTSWTGDLTGTTLSQKVIITKSISFNATFTVGAAIQDVPVAAGSSLNAEIKNVSALSIPGAILTPVAGKYDNNTIEIFGKVTLPIQRR
jgi:uncharacterized repeat protein (TIGR02543 family)